ncbi:bifunctional non-homologous end joining protein LigD [Paracoccus aminovorans]|uniref:DNA ligase (ATP) n=2 Tax=Paracoccus aminovorans TaxID=34004 RepID=A0A1I3ACX9_9RHOB|nr:DNA ligase D [Paracoccus aminovorans]CQR84226.1 DNA ligase D [Paracoccus aminovorans]SFH47569.1 bifunctional non-homologous end joining protein LigD [Paracoccus aminovorans]
MALETYREKRDFSATPEPRGGRRRRTGHAFVIQKHAATRLHYDFRLELDGVLKSWAVAKGPSLVPGEKRLAVHVEDHPLEYGDFEGTIPKGEYGGGTVILWDRGTWTPEGDPHQAYAKGHLEFTLHGEKLGGRWHLVRMRGKPREKRENWLLIKGEDDFARGEDAPDILEERPESVKTGRVIADVAGEAPGWSSKTGRIRKTSARAAKTPEPTPDPRPSPDPPEPAQVKGARKAAMPGFVPPMLATLVSAAPQGDRWLHEIKFDGYRLQARIEAGRVKLLTRSGLDWTARFGKAVPQALRDLPVGSAILDGELVVETDAGASDFSALQADLSAGRDDRFAFYAFDLLYLDGYDLRGAALVERKALLAQLLGAEGGPLRYSGHFDESGALVLRHACRLSLEGIVSKLRDGPYRTGRGKSWVKSKCSARQEFVVAGYVPSSVSRRAIGSLILGVYGDGGLEHVGRVGTGFSAAVAEDLFRRLERLRIPESPFAAPLTAEEARQARFVRPELVAEVEFRAWTADGHLRHAAFRGIREDKQPEEIVRETAKPAAKVPAPQRRRVRLTHPDRIYWPAEGVTKEGLADYYAEVWRHISPWITGRPLALLRCPNGIEGEKFFQKHAWKGISPHVVQVQDPKDPQGEPLIAIEDLDGLMGLVQSATLEIHPWGSTLADWERPDLITMDLDPGEAVEWSAVIAAARELRRRFEDHGLSAFVKTSGGKGLHVVAPLRPQAEWPAVKAFTKAMADAMAADDPDRYVSTISKAKRRGKILIDYLRNQRGATAVAAYSTRARPGAAVSAPLRWEELDEGIGPAWFTIQNMPTRLATLAADPWEGFRAAAVPLKAPKTGRKKA